MGLLSKLFGHRNPRLAGDAYRTRLALGDAATPGDKTRLAQEGYKSRFARDAAGVQPDTSEFYRLGEKIGGRYEVSAIHHGELGVVYGCFDHRTKLPRALKTVRARHAGDKQVLSLFESEATVWISLEKHPYIVRAYLVERFKSLPYVITEYVRGPQGMEGDLRGWLGHPRLTLPVAVAMALQIAQGMQHAVRKVPNLVHRDLKPANILVSGDAKAMVTDFGLVHSAQSDAGTPAYMSPEQWRADALDARSDIYAYGCILFEMFTAHRLFPALTERDWQSAHLASPPAALTSIVPELAGEIDGFVRRCLGKDPAARPRSWDEIVAFFADWYHRLTGKAVVLDFSSLARDANEWVAASYSLSNLKRYEEAINSCDRALAIDQNSAAAWTNKGAVLGNLERYEEAIQAYDRALAIDQNFAFAWNNKGIALGNLERYEEAIQAYDQAIAIDQNDAFVWRNKGNTLGDLKRYEEAIQACDRALAIDANYASAWNSKGSALQDLRRYEEAIQAYDGALTIDQNFAFAWINKGKTLYDLKRYEEAVQAFDRALAIDQNDAAAWANKGGALYRLKRYEEAIQACDRALAIDQNYVPAWGNKGNALGNLKRYEEVIQACNRALAIDQNYVPAWGNKGNALSNLNRYEEAIQAYDRALAIDQNDAGTWINKGNALFGLKRYEEAIQVYDRALAIDQNYVVAWANKGGALYYLKRYEEAIQACDRALAIDAKYESALRGRKMAADAFKATR
ncbi:MAG: tetratricopeptide repeat protein [Betaproteobacteria bacterium]|nr:tetratricopeptide repeat protein [Betaproteobacteria bacterium]